MVKTLIDTTQRHFLSINQVYLAHLYKAIFATAYYGLFRIGELTKSDHVMSVGDVQAGTNKKKLSFTLRSSKTHSKCHRPQIVKIDSTSKNEKTNKINDNSTFCPYDLINNYVVRRPGYKIKDEQFFVFSDNSPVQPHHVRSTLKLILCLAGYAPEDFCFHTFRAGRASDLLDFGLSVETIKKIGRWKLNAIFAYLK